MAEIWNEINDFSARTVDHSGTIKRKFKFIQNNFPFFFFFFKIEQDFGNVSHTCRREKSSRYTFSFLFEIRILRFHLTLYKIIMSHIWVIFSIWNELYRFLIKYCTVNESGIVCWRISRISHILMDSVTQNGF